MCHILKRPRINTLFESALNNSVILVTAGEGCGKTYAVHSFLAGRSEPVFWIPLTEKDNNPWHFWETVIGVIKSFSTRFGKALEETGFPETPGQFNHFFSVLDRAEKLYAAGRDGKKRIVIADDSHLIREESILGFIKRLFAFTLPDTTFILISRTEPDINIVSLISKGRLAKIGADDLRFTPEEIDAYFRLQNMNLKPEEPEMIFEDTEGWVQALSLIVEEMRNGNKRYSRPLWKSINFRLMEETFFTSVSAPFRRFLEVISLFDEWPLEGVKKIAASLSGEKQSSGEELIESMNRLSPLIWYDSNLHGLRIHRAFLNFLREKQKELSPSETKAACSVFARWCKENNLFIDAAIYYGKAEAYGELLRTIYSFPRLMPYTAALSLLEILDRVLADEKPNEDDENFLFLRHITRAGLFISLGRYGEARELLGKTIREFEPRPQNKLSFWILSAGYNSLGSLSLITYRQTRDISRTSEYFRLGNLYRERHPYTVTGPASRASIASYVNFIGHPPGRGEFETLINTLTECIPYASKSMGGYLSGSDSLCRAELAFFRGDLGAAELYAQTTVFSARENGQYEIESKSLFYLYRIHLCNGNTPAFRETWEQMEAQLDLKDYTNRYAIYDIMAGWFHAHIGEAESIAPWLRSDSEESDLNLLFHNFETMVKAKYLFAGNRVQEVLNLLGRKEVNEGIGSFHLGVLELSALTAAVQNRMGNDAAALKTLEAAWEMSRPNSLDMPFIELGEDMKNLAGLALNEKKYTVPRSWLETIRNRASVYAKKLTATKEEFFSASGAGDVPFLTSQEMSILTGISRGLTREEIADNVSLSLNCVKTIIKTIYGKLGAFNSADAIRIAAKASLINKS